MRSFIVMHRENQISIFSDCSRACPGRHAHCRKVRSRDVLPHAVEVAVVHTYIDWLHPLTCMRYLRAAPQSRHLPLPLLFGNRNGVMAHSCGLCLSPQTAPSRHDGPHLGCPSDVSTQSQQRLETGVCVAVHSITKFCLNCLGRPRLLARLPKLTPFQTTVLVALAAVPAEGEYVAHGVFVPDHGLLECP